MIGKYKHIVVFMACMVTLVACYKEVAIPIEGDFSVKTSELVVPTTVEISNALTGAETFLWTFEGGNPSQSSERNPKVTYKKTGTYKIKLVASNLDGQQKTIEKSISINETLQASITYKIKGTSYAPVEVQFESAVKGNSSLEWTFEGGIPGKSTEANPLVQYNSGGPHKVKLKTSNGFRTIEKDTIVLLEADLTAKFSLKKPSDLYEWEAPLQINLVNESAGALSYKWTMAGASPASSTAKNPVISYTTPGTYKITLETNNGKINRTSETEIEIKADKGYRIYENLKLGISAASDSLACFFSTQVGAYYKNTGNLTSVEKQNIDIVFFGLDQNFSFMQFVSPNKSNTVGFDLISSNTTKFLNNQILVSAAAFESLDKDQLLALPIAKTLEITKFIAAPLPQVVLFENKNGKKGAILVKESVKAGNLSYILVDIKVLK